MGYCAQNRKSYLKHQLLNGKADGLSRQAPAPAVPAAPAVQEITQSWYSWI